MLRLPTGSRILAAAVILADSQPSNTRCEKTIQGSLFRRREGSQKAAMVYHVRQRHFINANGVLREIRVVLEKAFDDFRSFFSSNGAYRVDKNTSRREALRVCTEQIALPRGKFSQVLTGSPVLHFRVVAKHSQIRARCVHQHAIEKSKSAEELSLA